jgi:hypothetical protein
MSDGSWSDYVADAGSDPAALAGVSAEMGDAITAAEPDLESIDTSGLPEQAADGVASAQYNTSEAASWQDQAAGDVQDAQEWAAFGNMDAAQESLNSAATASDIAADTAGTAQTDLGIGAEYMDSASSDLPTAADATAYNAGASSYDSGAADTSTESDS